MNKVLIVLFSFCATFESACCATREEMFSRGSHRRSNNDRTEPPPASFINLVQESLNRIESIFISIDNKLQNQERDDEKIENILTRLENLDKKIDKVEDKFFNDDDDVVVEGTSLSISAKLSSWEKKINRLEEKLDDMKRRFDMNLDESLNEPMHVNLCDNEQAANIAIIALQMRELLESFQEKVEQKFSSAGAKLEYLQRYLQIVFEELIQKNILKPVNEAAPIRRTERRIANGTGLLINEIVTMVKTKLKPDVVVEEEDDTESHGGSLTDIVSSLENMKSMNSTQKTKTTSTSATRKDGVIFPNVKNKPLKLNNTFLAETGTRDARVRY